MYIKAKCLSELINIKPITYDDLRKNILNIFTQRVYIPKSIRRYPDRTKVFIYLLKCEHIYQYIVTSLGCIARLPKTSMLHGFYAELINIASDNMYDKLIEETALCIRILTNLWKKYRKAILRSKPNEAKAYAQEFIGRAISIVKRKLKMMPILNEVIKTAKTAPCINFNDPIIIVSGMPQVGKSTLVGRISSAKPLVSPYPFTTKNIIIGHIDLKYVKIQIIDTPGLLDRNIDEMNEIERKAIATLKHLNSVVLYLIDPTQEAYYSFERQISSLRTVEQLIGKEKIIIVLNKIDMTPKELLISYENMLKHSGYSDIVMISALHGINIEELIYKAISKYDELYNTNYKQFLHK